MKALFPFAAEISRTVPTRCGIGRSRLWRKKGIDDARLSFVSFSNPISK
jgi:hypothetical protein